MVNFPGSWLILSNKELRISLLAFLRELADSCIKNKKNTSPEKQFDIDEIYHFFFDDTDLGLDAHAYIGEALLDAEEADAITRVTTKLDEIFKLLGDRGSDTYLSNALWTDVVESASIAYSELQKDNRQFDWSDQVVEVT